MGSVNSPRGVLLALAVVGAFGCAGPERRDEPFQTSVPKQPVPVSDALSSATADPGKKTCVVLAVGDVMMGTRIPTGSLPPDDGRGLFAQVKPYLKGDIVFANLEGVLADGPVKSKCRENSKACYQFIMPTSYARLLSDAGFNVVSVNNNHSLDAKREGLLSTMRTLNLHSIKHTGLVGDVAEFQVGDASVAVIGFGFDTDADFYSILNIPAAQLAIRGLKQSHRIVIVAFHGGAEGEGALRLPFGMEIFMGEHRGDVREFARAAVDAGADLVLGSSPHVPRAMELYRGRLIAYSLGNFQTYKKMSLNGPKSLAPLLAVQLNLADGSFASGRIIPFKQVGEGIPVPDPQKRVIRLMDHLSLDDIPGNPLRVTKDGALHVARAR